MEPTSTPLAPNPKRSSPWGLFIGLVLILVIIVGGAYYALTQRLAPTEPAVESTY